ncbi:MAG: ABC transporter substrate-binding protein [Actinomycetota bacterium]
MSQPSSSAFKLTAIFVVGVLVGAFSAVQVAPRTERVSVAGPDDPLYVSPTIEPSYGGPLPSMGPTPTSTSPTGEKLECESGRNGGATAPGVTGDSIKMATTVVHSGIGAAFLGEVEYGMEAVRNAVNREGGICGRQLEIKYVDDGWEPQRGAGYIRNFIKEGYFDLPVVPSSEGLQVVIKNGDINKARIPVVGTDGMVIDQYREPWVWPVAAATVSSARIMARDAHSRGAKAFGIVFDKNYKFGSEAALAYNNEVKRLTGRDVDGYNTNNNCQRRYCGVEAGQPSYATQVQEFSKAGADFIAMFLEPTTALTWMATTGVPTPKDVAKGIGAAQPLFTWAFGKGCQAACDQMMVWTSFKGPIEEYANDPAVKKYVSDLKTTAPGADEYNAFTQGGYVGMLLLVDALKRVGPKLTRDALRAVLDSTRLSTGLTIQPTLKWSPKDHFANATMQAFTMQYKGSFSGWRSGQIVTDPTPQRGTD